MNISCVSWRFAEQIQRALTERQLSHQNGSKPDSAKMKPLVFSDLASPRPVMRSCSFSWFSRISACYLLNPFFDYIRIPVANLKPEVILRPTFTRPVSSGVNDRIVITDGHFRVVDVRLPLWWEDWSEVYSCCWTSTAKFYPGPSPSGLTTVFYWLKFEISQLEGHVIIFIPAYNKMIQLSPKHWVPISSPLTIFSATVNVLKPPPLGRCANCELALHI
jgi:hypothetical protein